MPTYPEASAFAVTSADGTPIAFDRVGEGPPLVVVGGILCDCRRTRPLAVAFSSFATVLNVDRRGRGASGDTPPYSLKREFDDLAAIIEAAGGGATLYGYSSGAGLALDAIEKISYQMPTFYQRGNLVHFAAYASHIGLYPTPSAIRAFSKELRGYKTSKGAIRLPLDAPLPLRLIAKIVKYRVAENTRTP